MTTVTGDTGDTSPPGAPFAADLPSPILPVLALRNDAPESVVALGGPSDLQRRTYRPGTLDAALLQAAEADPKPHAILLTGSAGSGKSAAVEAQRDQHPGLFSGIVEDATHADEPSQTQADALKDRLAGLADGAARPDPPLLIAANTGMLLQLFRAWRPTGEFAQLEAAILSALGLTSPPPANGDLRVTVLNLDDRPTAGPGSLLEQFLPQLDPDDPGGIMAGAARCGTCQVRGWCPVRTNAVLASRAALPALSQLGHGAARERGRHDSPRSMWDWISRIIAPPAAFAAEIDPCQEVARAARDSDLPWLLENLLPTTAFSATSDLGYRVAQLSPALQPTRQAYELLAAAGIDPVGDAASLAQLASIDARAEAAQAAAAARAAGAGEDIPEFRQLLGRTAVGAAALASPADWPLTGARDAELFARALEAYASYQSRELRHLTDAELTAVEEAAVRELEPLVFTVAQGLARLLGRYAEGRAFLPLRSYDPRERGKVHVAVQASLGEDGMLPVEDSTISNNGRFALSIGYLPLAIELDLHQQARLVLDLPTYRLLAGAAAGGLVAASQGDERFHALRRAAEALARDAAARPDAQLLAESGGRAYLITQAAGLGRRRPLRVRQVAS
jgi:hypothetical protein